MDQNTVLRYHALYQKSWTGKPRDPARTTRDNTSPAGLQSKTPRDRTSSPTRSSRSDIGSLAPKRGGLKLNERTTVQKSQQQNEGFKPKRLASKSESPSPTVRVTLDPLSSRRNQRSTRSRPWSEKVPQAPARSDDFDKEMVYEAFLPKDESVEYRARKYVTNPRYGQLYEVRREKSRPTPRDEPDPHWLWEERFRLWRLEMATSYHNQKLLNQRRHLASTVIQRRVRGFLVRKHIKDMKRQALLGLGRAWPKITKDYRDQLTRIQVRQGVDKPSSPFSLVEMQDYIDKREKYERAFEKIAPDNKLSRDQLTDFLQECGHFPTEGEATAAFNTVFKGSGSTAEVVFVLDLSSSVGDRNFRDLMTFVKDMVRALPVGKDRVRVGVVPYNTDVFQSFGLRQHSTTEEILHAVDQIRFRPGVTHTDLALRIMMDIFQDSRPGVQKVAVVVTDGQSAHVQRTALEAKRAADSNVTVFALGVGDHVQTVELEAIARDTNRVLMCSSYRALVQLKQFVSSKLCLRACTLCQYILPRVQLHGLYKAEAVEIVFTLFPPPPLPPFQPPAHSTNQSYYHGLPPTASDTEASNVTHQVTTGSIAQDLEDDRGHNKQSSDSDLTSAVFSDKKPYQETTSDVATYASEKGDGEMSAHSASGVEKTDPEMTSTGSGSGGENSDFKEAAEKSGTQDSPPTSASLTQAPGRSRTAVTSSTSFSDVSQSPALRSRTAVTSVASTSHTSLSDSSLANILALADETGSESTLNSSKEGNSSTPATHAADPESTPVLSEESPPTSLSYGVGAKSAPDFGEDRSTPPASRPLESGRTPLFRQDPSSTPAYLRLAGAQSMQTSHEDRSTTTSNETPANPNDGNNSASKDVDTTKTIVTTTANDDSDRNGISSAEKGRRESNNNLRPCAQGSLQDVCRPLSKSEALEVVWTLQPLPASGLNAPRSRWIRPLVDGEPAWGLLDEKIIKATDFKVCLGLVVKSRLEREGVVTIPSDVRAGVEEVTTYEEAMQKIEAYLAQRKVPGGSVE
ncbi:hypothetical protein ACOMHN_060336 [Nucella lapillus]